MVRSIPGEAFSSMKRNESDAAVSITHGAHRAIPHVMTAGALRCDLRLFRCVIPKIY